MTSLFLFARRMDGDLTFDSILSFILLVPFKSWPGFVVEWAS